MLTVSLHGIRINAPHGLYKEEQVLGNEFEVDVDVFIATEGTSPLPFADYSLMQVTVSEVFKRPAELLETIAFDIHTALKQKLPTAEKIKVTIRKFHPPLPGDIKYAQVQYEH